MYGLPGDRLKLTRQEKEMAHNEKVKAALNAIDAVFGDMSVSQEQTLESLGTLLDEIEMKIEAIQCDIDDLLASPVID